MTRWRLIVIPATIVLSIGSLFIPWGKSKEETVKPQTNMATLILVPATQTPNSSASVQETEQQQETADETNQKELLREKEELHSEEPQKGLPEEATTSNETTPVTPGVPAPPSVKTKPVVRKEQPSATASSSTASSLPIQSPSPTYVEMDSTITAPKFDLSALSRKIVYPPVAKRKRIEGEVMLKLYVSADGLVERVESLSVDDYGFADAARNAFLNLQGKPAEKNGKPIAVILRYPIHFSLR